MLVCIYEHPDINNFTYFECKLPCEVAYILTADVDHVVSGGRIKRVQTTNDVDVYSGAAYVKVNVGRGQSAFHVIAKHTSLPS
jgi:hypothetical protein